LRELLAVFDDLDVLERLLAQLLARRDQWLPRFTTTDASALRPVLEGALARLVDDELAGLAPLAQAPLFGELQAALQQSARHGADEGVRTACAPWLAIDEPPPITRNALGAWQGAAALLLTRAGEWRQRISKREGFGAEEHPDARERLERLLAALRDREPLRAALRAAEKLPEPRYSERQWRHLAALRTVLLHLAAELKLELAEQGTIDFVELGIAARGALGKVDEPSDLLLALDRRIQHLLVDEFQDTSQSQLELLELLTAGWQHGDGRTLFVVGDPMQSIYRFRDADMSLFLEAKQHGIGNVQLESLTLERNFRSAPRIVDWVNATFADVFPKDDDIARGLAGFRASAATRAPGERQLVEIHPLRGDDPKSEVARAVEILEAELARDPGQSIAVLVQSRSHLAGLRERLREKGLPAHAVEIDALAEQPVVQDVLGLARALVHREDRIAWLAVLRAPWCGTLWADLHVLCQDARDRSIWELLHDAAHMSRLSTDGRRRIEHTRAILAAAFAARSETSFARWVERTWNDLDGPACIDHADESRAAEQIFGLLAREERGGDIDDPTRLEDALAAIQLLGDPPREQGIEIMTMHRAKGLEFDTVIALGLGRDPRPDEGRALYWLERVSADGSVDLLIAPKLDDPESERLTDFVRSVDRDRDMSERARLLYVATTRARERLHLICQLSPRKKEPATGALLELLWSTVGPQIQALGEEGSADGDPDSIVPVLRRLAAPARESGATQFALPFETVPAREANEPMRPEFTWASPTAAHVGTIVHRHLQGIAEIGLDAWKPGDLGERLEQFAAELRLLGVDRDELESAARRVAAALRAALDDPHGRWVLAAHEDARSELRLTLRAGDLLEHVRLDRTFVADGKRWIIDFKTGQHEGADREAFLASEVERYRPQLDRYAAALAAIDSRPVHVGLYFPLLRELRTWPAARD
jgi:ATP-dependent exoDNAse (exonuclease V) beta subunit